MVKNHTECSQVKTTLEVIGGKWKPLILWLLSDKIMRFGQLNRSIGTITQKMLTQTLREMEADGLIKRKVYPEVPPKVEYSLAEYGKTLEPILKAMHGWGKNHKTRQLK